MWNQNEGKTSDWFVSVSWIQGDVLKLTLGDCWFLAIKYLLGNYFDWMQLHLTIHLIKRGLNLSISSSFSMNLWQKKKYICELDVAKRFSLCIFCISIKYIYCCLVFNITNNSHIFHFNFMINFFFTNNKKNAPVKALLDAFKRKTIYW